MLGTYSLFLSHLEHHKTNMSLTKKTITDKIESVRIQDHYLLQVREAIQVLEDGNVISQKFNRYVLQPDHDVSTSSIFIRKNRLDYRI